MRTGGWPDTYVEACANRSASSGWKRWALRRFARTSTLALLAAVALSLLLLAVASVQAQGSGIVTVNTTQDDTTSGDGQCTLREAVANADSDSDTTGGDCAAGSGADTVDFSSALDGQTIELSRVDPASVADTPAMTPGGRVTAFGPTALLVRSQIAIEGPTGDSGVTLARETGVENLRLFGIAGVGDLTLRRLTLRDGLAQGGNGGSGSRGGGGGAAGLGGAIFNNGGTLRLESSTLTANRAKGGSGGSNAGSGTRGGGGGGLAGNGGNSGATGGAGGGPNGGSGGIPNEDGTGSGGSGGFGGGGGGSGDGDGDGGNGGFGGGGGGGGGGSAGFGGGGGGGGAVGGGAGFGGIRGGGNPNTAGGAGAGLGGAVFNNGGTLIVTNSTLSTNTARGGSDAPDASNGLGGAIFSRNGSVDIDSSTLASNTAPSTGNTGDGGALYLLGDGATLTYTVVNSLFADSTDGTDPVSDVYVDRVNSGMATDTASGFNLVERNGSDPQGPDANDLGGVTQSADPQLGPLASNGGPTLTRAVAAGGPAVDTGQTTLGEDQRGVVRPQDGDGSGTAQDDIGAFELGSSFSVGDVKLTEGDSGTTAATFTVTRQGNGSASVGYGTSTGTATPPGDYRTTSGRLAFAGNERSKNVSVPVSGDLLDEDDESFSLHLGNPSTGASISDPTGRATITDDDAPPRLSVSDASVAEGDAGTRPARFAVSLSAPSAKRVTVRFATRDGTARVPSDYVGNSGRVSFDPGETERTFTVVVNGDTANERDETFRVRLSDASNATLADAAGQALITDDDDEAPPPPPPPPPPPGGPPACTITGTSGNDIIRGTPGNDVICAGDGNDIVYGAGGDDVIRGGAGNDVLRGQAGNDRIDGSSGNDTLIGGEGRDRLLAGSGSDNASGQDGADSIDASDGVRGNDTVDGGPGEDSCSADPGDERTSC